VSRSGARRARIIATLGPASRNPAVLRRMIEEGVDWVRLNYSHGDHEEQARAAETLWAVAGAVGRRVSLMADLGGAKVRLGGIPEPMEVRTGDEVVLGTGRDVPEAIPVTVPRALANRMVGETLFASDGAVELEVVHADRGWVRCRVGVGGTLRSHGGLMLGEGDGGLALTAKDRDDLIAAVALGVDAVCLPLGREDALSVRALLPEGVLLVAKVEDGRSLRQLAAIAGVADAVLIARGPLACAMPRHEVPLVQKEVLARCAADARLGLVSTEVMPSMVRHARPTRAEASDVTTALLDGAEGLVLSEETAVGAHPAEAVSELRRIVEAVEASGWYQASRARRADEG
jgi:pyruvate kinase